MKHFNFWANAVDFGNWTAEDVEQAKELFASDAGYKSWSDMIERTGDDDVQVVEVMSA